MDKFTDTATLLTTARPGSEYWHEARRNGIGGSDIAAILGLSKWTSPYTLWAKKTGRLLDSESSSAMEWGNRLEPVIFTKFQEEHPELKVYGNIGTWMHQEEAWKIANPDGIYVNEFGEYGVLEIKTAMYEDEWRDGVPRYYEAQVQWYLATFNLKEAYVAVLFHGNKYEEYKIVADPFEQAIAHEAAVEFMNYILDDVAPAFDGATDTYETVRALHPEIDDTEVDVSHLYDEYMECLEVSEKAAQLVTRMKTEVMHTMERAKYGIVAGERVFVRAARGTGRPYLTIKNNR